MRDSKKVVIVLVLVAIIIAAVVWLISRGSRDGPPAFVIERREKELAEPVEKIDLNTGEVFTKSEGEWRELPHKGNTWQNPKTGEYTLVPAMICFSCHAKIPAPVIPEEIKDKGPLAVAARAAEYKCPQCGKSPFPPMAGRPPPPR